MSVSMISSIPCRAERKATISASAASKGHGVLHHRHIHSSRIGLRRERTI